MNFIESVEKGLIKCGISLEKCTSKLGAAVSGGADSVAMLFALAELCKKVNLSLTVISVNHFIRPDEETCGDFNFVRDLCNRLNSQTYDVEFFPYELEKGSVEALAEKNACGIEAAARELRYKAFYNFIEKENLSALCLAHNQNDNLETLLMRFLQGSAVDSSAGIPCVNGKIIRPLIDISRSEIEAFLVEKNESWRTDASNFDQNYLRNKIRGTLIPFLDENFGDWKKSLLLGGMKAFDDGEAIADLVEEAEKFIQVQKKQSSGEEILKIKRESFDSLKRAVKIRLLLKAMNRLGVKERIPYQFLREVVECSALHFSKVFADIEISSENNVLFIKKIYKIRTDLNFFAIIEEEGEFNFPFGKIFICKNGSDKDFSLFVNENCIPKKIKLPLCIRSFRLDDEIKKADGSFRKIKDIFADWHVPEKMRNMIPVIQELYSKDQENICILGSLSGFKDWIVL
ncbi:MAG: tRNA lysidine(34) synthetase TilS [Treponema sp.]|nr:tRNA lysidine(34) synthetase TilS [Treponema sp.]